MSQAASRLSDLTSLITKGTTPSTLGLNFADAGVPFLRAQNLRDGRVDVDADPLFIPPETHKALARSRIVAGDILLSIAGTIGRAALVDDRWPELNCNQAVAIIRPTEKVDPKYLLHWLNSQGAVGQITKSEVTATISNLSLTQIGNLVVALPSLSEQRRIAAILDQADDLRRKRRESLELLEGLARVIFLEMFGDPVTNSRGWVICSFGEAGTLDRGVSKHRPRNDPTLLGGPYPLIQTGDIANCDGYVRSYNATYSEQGLKQSKLWPKGTLCITIAANIGNTGILAFDACFPDSVVGFTPNSAVRTEFVQQWLGFVQPSLEEDAPQFAQKNINLGILRSLKLPLPSLELQAEFAARVAEIDKLKAQHRTHLAKLDALFASLQHRAFRGEL